MKGLLLIGIFMFYSISSVWGQDVIKQYAGTAMLYPVQEDSFHLSTSDMVPFYINHLGRHGARFPTSGKALDKAKEALILGQQENRLTTDGKLKYYSLHYSIYLIVLRDSGENCQCWESWNKRELPDV